MKKDGYDISDELAALQRVEVDLLAHLITVCQRHGLRMWLALGSLLGAVRHKGMIPWDDDIDVFMLRPDYDRLVALATTDFPQPYFLQTAYNDVGYYRPHAQLRNSQTAAIRPSDCYRRFNQGIFIDIFPLDGVPTDEAECERTRRECRRIERFLKAADCDLLLSGRLTLLFRKLRARHAIRRQGWATIYGRMENILRQYPVGQSEWVASRTFVGDRFRFRRSFFDETLWVPFDGIKAPIPKGWEEILLMLYGRNYMTPKHFGTVHGDIVIDTRRSYREVRPEVEKAYRRSMLSRLFRKLFNVRDTSRPAKTKSYPME